jgi:TonB-dependent receptor
MYKASLRRKMITSVSATVMAALTATATAQEAEEVTDEVVVTGIRQALESSLDVKRNAKGIVDSISAEDMGKFPDSNLAESLQRVTGIAIDRDETSGEGSTVTVRGFGSDYNLVTLNGRIMPTSTLGNFAGAPFTRSYDFGNLAPEAVSGVDIYKTSRASAASGGMGATIDIRTTRPLSMPGFNSSVSVKTVDDKSTNEDPETEISAIFYNTFMDDRIGLAVTAINQKMNHTVASWQGGFSAFEAVGESLAVNDEATDTLNGAAGLSGNHGLDNDTLLAYPFQGSGYHISDLEQERENFQITFQAQLADNITFTYDHSASELEHLVRSRNATVYLAENTDQFAGGYSTANYADNGSNPATILDYSFTGTTEAWPPGSGVVADDVIYYNGTMGLQNNSTEVTADGINIEWDVSENLFLEFDLNRAVSESLPLSEYGSNAYINTWSKVNRTAAIDYTGDIPVLAMSGHSGDCLYAPHPNQYQPGGCARGDGAVIDYSGTQVDGDVIWPGHRALGNAVNAYAYSENEIEQFQVNGSYDFGGSDFAKYVDLARFGVSLLDNQVSAGSKSLSSNTQDGNYGLDFGNFASYANGQGLIGFFSEGIEPLRPYFSDFESGNDIPYGILNIAYEDLLTLHRSHQISFPDNTSICNNTNSIQGCLDAPYTTMQKLDEETVSAYVEFEKDFDLYGRPASVVAGLRYEDTEVTSQNYVPTYTAYTQRTGADAVKAQKTGSSAFMTTKGGYDYLLPSIDFNVDLLDDVKLRAAFSQTIARHTYDLLAGGTSITEDIPMTKQAPLNYSGNGSEGNPNLEPFESTNFYLSTDWYYGDLSYLSVGYFSKEAENWVGTANRYENVQGIRHAGYLADGSNSGSAIGDFATDANELVLFNISYNAPSTRKETIEGIELAIQHDFADYNPLPINLTGFGFIANATFVESDADYNNQLPNSQNSGQFAVTGISDSANFIAYYERFGFSTRVAYNWRDAHLVYMGASSAYTAAYEQVDANISYAIPGTGLTISYDGINLNEEGREVYERDNPAYKTWASQGHAKHYIGVRYNY